MIYKKYMRIGELAVRTGVSIHTLRFYEKIGLIRPEDSRRLENNYRDYSEEIIGRILLIKESKMFGFTLREMRNIMLEWDEERLQAEDMKAIVKEKISAVDKKIEDLLQIRSYLSSKMERLNGMMTTTLELLPREKS
jgi:MerR family transcriptional regulator, copper efflux regulator